MMDFPGDYRFSMEQFGQASHTPVENYGLKRYENPIAFIY